METIPPTPHSVTFIRHFQQSTHSIADPVLKQPVRACTPGEHYDLIVCSPYRRCRETAAWINAATGRDTPIIVDHRLSEFQGSKRRRSFNLDRSTVNYGPIPGTDEDWDDCARRLDSQYASLQQHAGRRTILVVTHGVCVRYLKLKLEGKTTWKRGRDVPFGRGFIVET